MPLKHAIVLIIAATVIACGQSSTAWTCRATHDVQCSEGQCEVGNDQGIVPIVVSFDTQGNLSMCAYSGCWEGTGHVLASAPFFTIVGENLPWSFPDSTDVADVSVTLDLSDGVAVAKGKSFAIPMICESIADSESE